MAEHEKQVCKQMISSEFTLAGLPGDKSAGVSFSPACRQVKQYCFTCLQAGEAILLHLNRAPRCNRDHSDSGGNADAGIAAGA